MVHRRSNGNGLQPNLMQPHPSNRGVVNPEDNVFPTRWFWIWFTLSLLLPFGVAPLLGFLTPQRTDLDSFWWKSAVVYRLDIKKFRGVRGEERHGIEGLKKELPSLQESGVGAIWLSDVNHLGVETATSLKTDEVKVLVRDVHARGMRIILDFVPNYTPHDDDKFQSSRKSSTGPYSDFYVWHDGQRTSDGNRQPPNNWKSRLGGSAWTFDEQRNQYYLHQSHDKWFPDLNYSNPAVKEHVNNVLVSWLKEDVDGFVITDADKLVEASLHLDEPPSFGGATGGHGDYRSLSHVYTQHQSETFNILKSWTEIVASFNGHRLDSYRLLAADVQDDPYHTDWSVWSHYYDTGLTMPLNYQPMKFFSPNCDCHCMAREISVANASVPEFMATNWLLPTPFCVDTGLKGQLPVSEIDRKRYNLLSVLHMLLPGTPILSDTHEKGCDTDMPLGDRTHRTMLNALAKLRQRETFVRGKMQFVLNRKHLLSFARHASGILIPRFLVVLNFGPEAIVENFSMKLWKLNIPASGKVVFDNMNVNSRFNREVNITTLHVEPMQGLVIQW